MPLGAYLRERAWQRGWIRSREVTRMCRLKMAFAWRSVHWLLEQISSFIRRRGPIDRIR